MKPLQFNVFSALYNVWLELPYFYEAIWDIPSCVITIINVFYTLYPNFLYRNLYKNTNVFILFP